MDKKRHFVRETTFVLAHCCYSVGSIIDKASLLRRLCRYILLVSVITFKVQAVVLHLCQFALCILHSAGL